MLDNSFFINKQFYSKITNIEGLRDIMRKIEDFPKENEIYLEITNVAQYHNQTYEIAQFHILSCMNLISSVNNNFSTYNENCQILEIISKAPEIINNFFYYAINTNKSKPNQLKYYDYEIFEFINYQENIENLMQNQEDIENFMQNQENKIQIKFLNQIIGGPEIPSLTVFKQKFKEYVMLKMMQDPQINSINLKDSLKYLDELLNNSAEVPFIYENNALFLEKEKKYYLNKLDHVSFFTYSMMHLIKIFFDLTEANKYIPFKMKLNKVMHTLVFNVYSKYDLVFNEICNCNTDSISLDNIDYSNNVKNNIKSLDKTTENNLIKNTINTSINKLKNPNINQNCLKCNFEIKTNNLYIAYDDILKLIKKKQYNIFKRFLIYLFDLLLLKHETLNEKIETFNVIAKEYRNLQ